MIKNLLRLLYILGAVLLMASCSASRKLAKQPMVGGLSGEAYVEKVLTLSPEWHSLSAKVALTLDLGGKKTAKVNATLRMMRDKSVRLTVAPVLGIEVARLEITPQGVMALDRMNKRYVQLSFEELSGLTHTDLDFHILQSLFFNEIFLPGNPRLRPADARKFRLEASDGRVWLYAGNTRRLHYAFRTSPTRGWLEESRISLSDTPYALSWLYDEFTPLKDKSFPAQMRLAVTGGRTPMVLDMQLTRISAGGDWEPYTEIPARYRQMDLQELLNTFIK